MAFHNLHLATVALISDIDYYGIDQVNSPDLAHPHLPEAEHTPEPTCICACAGRLYLDWTYLGVVSVPGAQPHGNVVNGGRELGSFPAVLVTY